MTQGEEEFEEGIRWISVEDLLFFNRSLIERFTPHEISGPRSEGALESAQMRPAQHRYYQQTNDIVVLAAVLLTSIIQNHPFHNANKRTAFTACCAFLNFNGGLFQPPRDEAIQICVEIAQKMHDIDEVAWWINCYTTPSNSAELLAGCQEGSLGSLESFVTFTGTPHESDSSS